MERISLDLQRERIDELARLIAERRQAETSTRNSLEARDDTTNAQFSAERERLTKRFHSQNHALQSQHTADLEAITQTYEEGVEQAAADHERAYRETVKWVAGEQQSAQEDHEIAHQAAEQHYKDAVREAAGQLQDFKHQVEGRRGELDALERAAEKVLRRRWCRRAARRLPAAEGGCDDPQPLERFPEHLAAAGASLDRLRRQWAARVLANGWLLVIFVFTWIAAILLGALLDSADWPWIVASCAVSLGLTAITYVALRQDVVRQTLREYAELQQHLANAGKALDAARGLATAGADRRRAVLKRQREQEVRQADAADRQRNTQLHTEREARLKQAADALQQRRQVIAQQRDRRQDDVNQKFEAAYKKLHLEHERQLSQLNDRHQAQLASSREAFQRGWDRLVRRWNDGMAQFQSSVDSMNEFCRQRFPDWDQTDWQTWSAPGDDVPGLRFGQYEIRLDMFDGGLSECDELRPERTEYTLPAVMSFSQRPSLLLESWGEGRAAASRCMQNVMLRLLTSLPPGKVRFTIIDPVGLGQDFSAFMHLADYDEQLVSHRIWTETAHINQRLADLTEHMEDVIQKYLRNEFRSIDEYNRQAGEVAEPFQILVVANFPAGFSDEAAGRLLSIVGSGARCGVFTLLSSDSKLELPRNFDLADLEAHAATVQWDGRQFRWLCDDLADLPMTLDQPPGDQRLTEIIRTVGQRAQQASRVEVPFATVAPQPQRWWSGDSRGGIDVPLGRAGATKLQHLRLGSGTSQHVLISGKTGSGKSTLLHALVTNTALHYAPDEVEFYLIDFKKGVEFKPYAALRLPHARVVAIESEREFGMSVLERLDLELRRRGDLFREQGVQDIRSYRDANPKKHLPRALLIIDEFQEFFVQDDKLAQEAALLLDRLVRQGRAFGIHVLLGSQTLAGAYSLARSTIGQMAVRIALQCSEADSHLILSEDNTAARLLSRPGEAIYNDANGLFEGNHPFQVVWLPAREQEQLLRRLDELREARRMDVEPAIVFEGNVAADPGENELLRRALLNTEGNATALPTAWLGAAVAIKGPTEIVFRRQSGSNALLVGQGEEPALGVMASALVSLAATCPPPGDRGPLPRFHIFDGARPETPEARIWRRLDDCLPLDARLITPAAAAGAIGELAAEVGRRVEAGDDAAPPLFLLVYNLPRFRDLRRREDDFGFSSFDKEEAAAPDKQFLSILRDGPAVGVHALVWCDTYNNVSRWFDRQTLRDLDQRVLLQMSATDSSNLMDAPAASRLGVHRAILYSEEQGVSEKFRPYRAPSDDWLDWIASQLARRTSTTIALSRDGQ